jgi:hypothetical protein
LNPERWLAPLNPTRTVQYIGTDLGPDREIVKQLALASGCLELLLLTCGTHVRLATRPAVPLTAHDAVVNDHSIRADKKTRDEEEKKILPSWKAWAGLKKPVGLPR